MDDDEAETIAGKNTRTSSIWQHFDVLSEKDRNAECKQCREPFSFRTTITNLRRHLERKHNNDMINKQSDDEQDQMEEVYLDEEGLAEVSTDKRKILRNGAWEYFEVIDEAQRTARCRLCNEDFSYRTTSTNLNKHLMRKHFMTMKVSDDETGQEGEKGSTERSRSNKNSISWEYFSITDPIKRIATCKLCNTECSYWSSVSNLMKHVRRKHANATYPDDDDESDERDEKPPDVVNATDRGRSNQNSISWEYFTITDPVKRIATCKLCDCDRSYWGSVSNLMKHVRRRHGVGTNTEKYDSDDKVDTNNSKARSSIWLYFKCINKKSGKSMCLICKKKLSHRSSITNLKRHLQRKHPQIELGDGNADSKKMLLSSDGQLYEIDENTNEDAHDTEDDTDQQSEIPHEYHQQPYTSHCWEQAFPHWPNAGSDTDEEIAKSAEWSYFERQSTTGRARCAVCCASVPCAVAELKAHLKLKHPKLLAELSKDSDQEENDDDMYTEIVYLDDSNIKEEISTDDRPAYTSKNERTFASKPANRVAEKRKASYKAPEVLPKKKRTVQYSDDFSKRSMDDDELTSFGSYVTCLLKKFPRDVCMNLQRDIINLIMNAKLKKVDSESEKKIFFDGNVIRTSEGENYYLISNKKDVSSDGPSSEVVTALENHSYTIVSTDEKEKEKNGDSIECL